MRGGTGTRARLENQVAAGKTGTAQDFSDAWFVGYTPHLATAVWMGNPDEQIPMTGVDRGAMGRGNVFGGSLPAMIWGALNAAYHAGLEPLTFEAPERTRAGTRIRTDQEEDDYRELIESFCGVDNEDAEIDTDEDGVVDYCDPDVTEFEFDEGIGGRPCASPSTPMRTARSMAACPQPRRPRRRPCHRRRQLAIQRLQHRARRPRHRPQRHDHQLHDRRRPP